MVQTLISVLDVLFRHFPQLHCFAFSVQFQIPSLLTFDTYSIMYVVLVPIINRTKCPIKLR